MVTEAEYGGPSHLVHLHNHSIYSSLDGVGTPQQYAEACKARGYPAMALTEHGNMASVPDMYASFEKNGIKPIFGCEVYYCDLEPERAKMGTIPRLPDDAPAEEKEFRSRMVRNRHLTLLAKNDVGYSNLIKLTTQAYKNLYGKPRIWFDRLCEFKEGLIVLSGCLNGPVSHELRLRDENGKHRRGNLRGIKVGVDGAIDYIKKFHSVFGEDYFMELQMPGVLDDHLVFWDLVKLADKFKIKMALANDVHYLERKDYELQKIMMAIDQGVTRDSDKLFHSNSSEQYMKTRAELWATFKNGRYSEQVDDRTFEEMCDNTLLVAEKCSGVKIDKTPKIPTFKDASKDLIALCKKRLREFGFDKCDKRFLIDGREVTYMEQTSLELRRFIDKGFTSYFLITKDLIDHGRSKGWPFCARGSAGGSLVCYLLGISNVNPMLWGLSFDRFLSPSRGGFLRKVTME